MRVSGIGKNDCKIDDYLEEINAHVLLFLFFFFFWNLPHCLSQNLTFQVQHLLPCQVTH